MRNNYCYADNKSSQKLYGQNAVLLNATATDTHSKQSTFKILKPEGSF